MYDELPSTSTDTLAGDVLKLQASGLHHCGLYCKLFDMTALLQDTTGKYAQYTVVHISLQGDA